MKNTILITAFLIAATFTSVAVKADSDIDFDDGVLYIETDDHDDVIILVPDGDKLAVCIWQMDNQVFDYADEISNFVELISGTTLEEFHDAGKEFAAADRFYRRDFDEIHTIVVDSGSGDDGVYMFDENDLLPVMRMITFAGSGNDLVHGNGSHRFSFSGQAGEDILSVRDPLSSYMSGGDDSDRIAHHGINPTTIRGGEGHDEIEGRDSGRMYVWGDAGNDRIVGGSGNDRIYGGDDNDVIQGREGNDEIFGNDGVDTLLGGSGNDFLEGGYDGFIDFLHGGSGFDEGIHKYFRYASLRFRSKDLMRTLEEEECVSIEIKSGREK